MPGSSPFTILDDLIVPPPARTSFEPFPQASALEQALRAAVRGDVRFDDGTRALYATDASNYRQIPIGIVTPPPTAAAPSAA